MKSIRVYERDTFPFFIQFFLVRLYALLQEITLKKGKKGEKSKKRRELLEFLKLKFFHNYSLHSMCFRFSLKHRTRTKQEEKKTSTNE